MDVAAGSTCQIGEVVFQHLFCLQLLLPAVPTGSLLVVALVDGMTSKEVFFSVVFLYYLL